MKAKARKKPPAGRKIAYIIIAFVAAYAVGSAALRLGAESAENRTDTGTYTLDKAKQISELFVRASPTYSFDGNFLEFKTASSCGTNCFNLNYKFVSSHAGYGSRANQALAQVITNHDVDVVVQDGEITSAVIDGKWDELNQRMLDE